MTAIRNAWAELFLGDESFAENVVFEDKLKFICLTKDSGIEKKR